MIKNINAKNSETNTKRGQLQVMLQIESYVLAYHRCGGGGAASSAASLNKSSKFVVDDDWVWEIANQIRWLSQTFRDKFKIDKFVFGEIYAGFHAAAPEFVLNLMEELGYDKEDLHGDDDDDHDDDSDNSDNDADDNEVKSKLKTSSGAAIAITSASGTSPSDDQHLMFTPSKTPVKQTGQLGCVTVKTAPRFYLASDYHHHHHHASESTTVAAATPMSSSFLGTGGINSLFEECGEPQAFVSQSQFASQQQQQQQQQLHNTSNNTSNTENDNSAHNMSTEHDNGGGGGGCGGGGDDLLSLAKKKKSFNRFSDFSFTSTRSIVVQRKKVKAFEVFSIAEKKQICLAS